MRTWPALEVALRDDQAAERLQIALVDVPVAAVGEDGLTWQLFFQTSGERDRARSRLAHTCPDLALHAVDVPDDDWAARSQASVRAVRVGRIVVAPPWDVPSPGSTEATTIVILPSMGFGTAHHATTRLCLALMQRIDLTGASVTDLGTGSGVLAITASRLGAVRVLAIEDDPDAAGSAAENLALNPEARVDLRLADMRAMLYAPADLVVANLTGALLAQEASRIQTLATPAGHLILSGFLSSEEAAVTAAFTGRGWAIADRLEEDGWVSVHFRR